MPEYYGPLGETYEDAQRTIRRVETVQAGLGTAASSEVLRLAVHEPVAELRAEAEAELGKRLDLLDEMLAARAE